MKTVLSVAGYDPSSGAGVTKDLETILSCGLHGLTVPTCAVIQGPLGVRSLFPADKESFREALGVLSEETPVDGVKVGVLCDAYYVETLSEFISPWKVPTVVDPVLAAKNGTKLITPKGLQRFIERILPLATVVMPNWEEASALSGLTVTDLESAEKAARKLLAMGPRSVVVKGGHSGGDPVDLLYDGKDITIWSRRRVKRQIHGTGCTLSSLLISFLVLGYPLKEAFAAAEERMEKIISNTYTLSQKGYSYLSPGSISANQANRFSVLETMKEAQDRLMVLNPVHLVPEVQMNLGFAAEGARGVEDVAAFPGRIGAHQGKLLFKGVPDFGSSSHVARLILNCMRLFPHFRSAANLRFDHVFIERARAMGMEAIFFDRQREPDEVKGAEGRSLDFLMTEALKGRSVPPDIIYDYGDMGKEPIIRLFARNPLELISRMEMIEP
jgi:hydroxymethylpyrimidine kinase / phosphomethylpyrimidine kinase / thiamine-phosphate diphosphorylase